MTTLSSREAIESAFSLGAEHSEQGKALDPHNPALHFIIQASDMPASELIAIYQQGYQDGLITF